jgi:hypothetical protein
MPVTSDRSVTLAQHRRDDEEEHMTVHAHAVRHPRRAIGGFGLLAVASTVARVVRRRRSSDHHLVPLQTSSVSVDDSMVDRDEWLAWSDANLSPREAALMRQAACTPARDVASSTC